MKGDLCSIGCITCKVATTVSSDPMHHVHVDFISVNYLQNVKIAYAHNGKRGAPLMLFIHGFPECWYSWRHQMDFFKDKYW